VRRETPREWSGCSCRLDDGLDAARRSRLTFGLVARGCGRREKETMRKTPLLLLAVFAASACTIEEGDFDGSFFDDDARVDEDDAGGDEDDGGTDPKDAGRDSGSDAGGAGSDASKPDDGGPKTYTEADVPGFIARGRCGALEACMGKTLLAASYEGLDCVAYVTKQLSDRHLHWLAGSVDADRVIFRPERLEQCEQDLEALGCALTTSPPPLSCEEAVEGKVLADQKCNIDQDCKGNAFCDKGELETCPGHCVDPQSSGLPCRASAECAAGLVCRGGVCEAPLSEGDPCSTRLVGSECPPGLVCQGASGNLMCQSIETVYAGKENEACDAFGKLCEMGLVCQSQSSANTMGTCVKPVGRGEACKRSQPSPCPSDQYCKDARDGHPELAPPGVSGVCSDLPKSGDDCDANPGCSPGLRCIGDPGECRELKSAGGECTSSGECYGGLCSAEVCAITTIECKEPL
jgi:hypothetical protein